MVLPKTKQQNKKIMQKNLLVQMSKKEMNWQDKGKKKGWK